MNRRIALMVRACATLCAATLLQSNAFAAGQDDHYNVHVVRGIEGPNSAKPAQVLFDREDGTSSTVLNAAVTMADGPLPGIGGVMDNSWGFGAGVSKNTLADNKSELYQVGANLNTVLALTADKTTNVIGSLTAAYENDRVARARGSSVVLDALLVSKQLIYDPNLNPGESGLDGRFYPSVGWYQRRVTSTDDATTTPVGHHAGPYVGLHATSRFLSVGKDASLFDRISVDLLFVVARDSSVGGGYRRATYRYGEASLDWLLYGAATGKGWKPTISVTKSRGTNRVADEPHVDKLTVAFKLSLGI